MHIVMTGASGRLGRELVPHLKRRAVTVTALRRRDVDVTDATAVHDVLAKHAPDVVVHAAGYTDVAAAETDRATCWQVNVDGTRNVASATRQASARLLHLSTDYVFWGGADRPQGGYGEDAPPGPVRNYYALSKLAAEEAARCAPDALIVRTSFREPIFRHPRAFGDLYTSQDYVDVIADLFTPVILRHAAIEGGPLHLGTERKSVYELVRRRTPSVERGTRADAPIDLPEDVSLNVDRFRALRARWHGEDLSA